MNPWTIIGWIFLALIITILAATILPLLQLLWEYGSDKRQKVKRHRTTKQISLAKGQYWRSAIEEGTAYRIISIPSEDDLIRAQRYAKGMCDSYTPMLPEEWNSRVEREQLYLTNG